MAESIPAATVKITIAATAMCCDIVMALIFAGVNGQYGSVLLYYLKPKFFQRCLSL
jgi:hypothetical protein